MARKIIQISATTRSGDDHTYAETLIVALCDDGTTWYRVNVKLDENWRPLPEIPQKDH